MIRATVLGFIMLLVAVFVCILIWQTVVSPALDKRRRRKAAEAAVRSPWTVIRDQSGQAVQVQVVKPGEEPFLIGPPIPVTLKQWEFEEQLQECLIEAQMKADALNRRLPA